MKARTLAPLVAGFALCLALGSLARAQEGHPFSGSWVGDWGPNAKQRNRVVVILDWNGKQLVGTINPGPNAVPVKVATVDPSKWSLHLEAEAKDASGKPVTYVIDGTIDDLGTYNRTLAGSWIAGGVKGDFSITRQ